MAFTSFLLVVLVAASAFGAPDFACKCNKMYDPVCGTNGQTYSNLCMLSCERAHGNDKLAVAYSGVCNIQAEEACACTFDYRPVCGSDGLTYGNLCALNCASKDQLGLTYAYNGECAKDIVNIVNEPCICTADYRPVCGSDGVTYGNMCALKCAGRTTVGLTLQYDGECKKTESCACPDNYMPVCGTDGKTYPNVCELSCGQKQVASLQIAYQGECTPSMAFEEVFSCACPDNYMPVCGSNGNTYANECELNCDKKQEPGLQVTYEGPCRK